MLSNQQKWPRQFDWSHILVNQEGLDVYQGVIDRKIPWTDSRVVNASATMLSLVNRGMYYPGINSIDLGPALIPWSQGKAGMWLQGNWMPTNFRGQEKTIPYPVDYFLFPKMGNRTPVMEVFCENTLMMH